MAIKNVSTKTPPAKGKATKAKSKVSPGGGGKGDTVEIIRSYLYSMRQVGIDQVDEKEILFKTGYARTDSKGYRNAIKELVKELGHVSKSKGTLSLTGAGLAYIEENGLAVEVKPATMEDHQAELRNALTEHAKAPATKSLAIWDVLVDGKTHSSTELLEAAEYQRTDSKGYREIMTWLRKLELLEKEGKCFKFSDKVYRYGARPN